MTIVVTTPTGNVGSRVTRLLVQAGERPRLVVRDPSRLDPDIRRLADVVEGDLLDRDDVLRATEGADALFWVDPPVMDEDPIGAYARAGANAAAAISEHGIARTVFQSSVGAEKRHGAGEIDGLAHTEEALDATGASVTHLRCGFFFTNLLLELDGLREGVLPTTIPIEATMPWVDPRDIGDVAAARLLGTSWSGRVVQAVHGPADLSYEQVAQTLTRALGRPVQAERISDDVQRARLRAAGLGEVAVEAVVGMSTGLREDFVPEQPRDVLTTTPTTLAAWSHTVLRPLL